jgi:DNA helicase-2/ATP-dependent DNA helicase PcrA
VLEEAMRTAGIPYRVMGGSSFFERKEVADCVAYLRAAVYPDDEIAIRRIINFPQRIGRTTVLKIADYGRAQRLPFSHALADAARAGVGNAQATAIAGFLSQLDAARSALATAEHAAASPPQTGQPAIAAWAEQWFRELGIFDAIHSDPRNDKSAVARVENVKDLAGTIARYERRAWSDAPLGALTGSDTNPGDEDWESPTLAGALASLALAELEMEEEEATEKPAAVSLMTLHSAKGPMRGPSSTMPKDSAAIRSPRSGACCTWV